MTKIAEARRTGRIRRHRRVRKKIHGTAARPRLAVGYWDADLATPASSPYYPVVNSADFAASTTIDNTYMPLVPGTVLLYRILQDLAAQDVPQVVDFGPGRHEYKSRFGTESYPTATAYLAARGSVLGNWKKHGSCTLWCGKTDFPKWKQLNYWAATRVG